MILESIIGTDTVDQEGHSDDLFDSASEVLDTVLGKKCCCCSSVEYYCLYL